LVLWILLVIFLILFIGTAEVLKIEQQRAKAGSSKKESWKTEASSIDALPTYDYSLDK
jgi:hypothetical protein